MASFPHDAIPFSLDGTFNNSDQLNQNHPVCGRCQHRGCDVKVSPCGCFLHARCTPVQEDSPILNCPVCQTSVRSLMLMPMNFEKIDEAKAAAASMTPSVKRGKKRKNATIARLNPSNATIDDAGEGSDLRTGRWTVEEALYCDKLIEKFGSGELPISSGIKLNDFLANMLKSKQSRLTKKMKNARLSAKCYKSGNGYIADLDGAKEFSEIEKSFFDSIKCDLERAEIEFHMQKEWRELFSTYCVAMGQKLAANAWLSSVEEMDRRASQAKDAARMARRKVMMGYALSRDSMNPQRGVFIERSGSNGRNEILSMNAGTVYLNEAQRQVQIDEAQRQLQRGNEVRSLKDFSSPFVGKVIQYMDRHQIPFEHMDAWVPSYVPNQSSSINQEQKCRLCFAGFASAKGQISSETGHLSSLSGQDHFDLLSFGEYSSKFSFDVGCGLPGRVYSSGVCSWEQGVANAPCDQFERCGGASQWGIKTVLGIPIPSPNVGRIVVVLYSKHDRKRDPAMVRRITDELTKLMPTPKWKLVVDVGATPQRTKHADRRLVELQKLLAEHMPTHRDSPYSPYLPGFTSLRLLLLKQARTKEETDLISTIVESFSSYNASGRSNSETAWMIARDYMLLSQSVSATEPQQVQQLATQLTQQVQHQSAIDQAQYQTAQQAQQQVQQMHHVQHHQVQTQMQLPQQLPVAHSQTTGAAQHRPNGGQVIQQQNKQNFNQPQEPKNANFNEVKGIYHHPNGIANPGSQLAPGPVFSAQQSAFQVIGHQPATAHHQSNSHVGA